MMCMPVLVTLSLPPLLGETGMFPHDILRGQGPNGIHNQASAMERECLAMAAAVGQNE
jgi:hypothetical protein